MIRTLPILLALLLLPATATAKGGGDDVRRAGTCSERSTSKIKLKADDGGLEVEFEVDQNRSGQRWRVTISRNGTRVVSTRATTRGPSGSFSLERRLRSTSGKITARAVSPSGEVCRASASLS
jgi:hypothetical protein